MWTCSQAHLPTCVVPLSLFLKVVAKLQQQEEAFFGSSAQAMQWRQFNQSVQLPLLLAYKFSAQTFSPLQQKQANDSSSKKSNFKSILDCLLPFDIDEQGQRHCQKCKRRGYNNSEWRQRLSRLWEKEREVIDNDNVTINKKKISKIAKLMAACHHQKSQWAVYCINRQVEHRLMPTSSTARI